MTKPKTERTKISPRFAQVLNQCQDMAVIFSNSQLGDMFEHSGTAFLDFAERAENDTMQSRFFEAMGLIQRRRADMEQTFRQQIKQGFEDVGHREEEDRDDRDYRELTDSEEAELSLIEREDMEESVAADNLVVKANAAYFPELYALGQRMAVVVGVNALKDEEIPTSPHHLVQSFRSSMDGLEVDAKIKVILYALFEKFVIKQAKGLYDELNESLKEAGILPNLKPVHVRSGQSDGDSARAQEGAEQPDPSEAGVQSADTSPLGDALPTASLGAELFESIVDLMSKRPGSRSGSARRRPVPQTAAERAAAAAASRDLVAAVGHVQSGTTPENVRAMVQAAAAVPNLQVDTVFVERVRETLNQERQQVLSQIDQDKLSPMDADLIDLIGMLFEYMLNDPVLPNLAKALLSHLHTPYLKVALIDRRLLVDANHPARQVLDKMVEAGSLWVEENNPQRGIFPTMQEVVDRVLREFSDDVALFDELLTFFESAVKEQQRKSENMEQRTKEVVRGREKLQLAKRRASQEVRGLLQRTALPSAVSGFLSKTWLDLLVFILLRNEEEDRSEDWRSAQKTGEDLVALFQPKAGAKFLSPDVAKVPDVRDRIKEAVSRMGSYSRSTMDALFALLDAPESWQESCAQTQASAQKGEAATPVPPVVEEAAAVPADLQVSAREQEIISRLRKMKFGTWFEFSSATGEAPRRIKLSWLSSLTSTCMFVDRSGMQAEIKTLQELAQEVLSGRAKVIPRPKHPFIERALVSIRNMLQGDPDQAPTQGKQQAE